MDTIEIVEYNPHWPALFLEEAQRLRTVLDAQEIIAIEHLGSTAIPGMASKPVIDISIIAVSLERVRINFVHPLENLSYLFWPDNPSQSELFFVKGMPPYGTGRTHHLRISEENDEIKKKRLFRDWLITHPEDAAGYEALKKELASKYPADREAYTKAKGDFIQKILSKAIKSP